MAFGKSQRLNKAIFFVVLVAVSLAVVANYRTVTQSAVRKNSEPLWTFDAEKISEGDLIFRKGRDLVSRLVLSQGNSAQFSHVGLILKNGGTVSVVHSLPEDAIAVSGVQIEPLSSFASFDNASDIAIYRFKGINGKLRQKVREYVLQQVGKPFDASFLLSTDDSIYCTELAIKAFAYAGVELTNLEPVKVMLIDELVIPPDHLRQSDQFERLEL